MFEEPTKESFAKDNELAQKFRLNFRALIGEIGAAYYLLYIRNNKGEFKNALNILTNAAFRQIDNMLAIGLISSGEQIKFGNEVTSWASQANQLNKTIQEESKKHVDKTKTMYDVDLNDVPITRLKAEINRREPKPKSKPKPKPRRIVIEVGVDWTWNVVRTNALLVDGFAAIERHDLPVTAMRMNRIAYQEFCKAYKNYYEPEEGSFWGAKICFDDTLDNNQIVLSYSKEEE